MLDKTVQNAAYNKGVPVLHALGEHVVGTLRDTDAVRHERVTAPARNGSFWILAQEFAPIQESQKDAVWFLGIHIVVFHLSFMCFLGNQVQISGCAEVGETGTFVLFAQIAANSIHVKPDLHIQHTKDHLKGFFWIQLQQPVANDSKVCYHD